MFRNSPQGVVLPVKKNAPRQGAGGRARLNNSWLNDPRPSRVCRRGTDYFDFLAAAGVEAVAAATSALRAQTGGMRDM